ncbi:MAG: ABC-three component system protein [Ignavibacteriales bacterium]
MDRHTAAKSLVGYLWQVDQALAWLVNAPPRGCAGIEVVDDIHIDDESKSTTSLIQTKYCADGGNRLSDRSISLWNTLAIWAEAVRAGDLALKNTQFYLVTNGIVQDGLIRQISEASTDEEASQVVQTIRQFNSDNKEVMNHVAEVNLLTESSLVELIRSIKLVDGSEANQSRAFPEALEKHYEIDSAEADLIAEPVRGWLWRRILEAVPTGQQILIGRKDLFGKIDIERDSLHKMRFREAVEYLATEKDVDGQKTKRYVAQLRAIECSEETVNDSIMDFLKARAQEIAWSKSGSLPESALDLFYRNLRIRWKTIFNRLIRSCGSDSTEQIAVGQEIFDQTMDHRERLAGQETDEYFTTRGRYHMLADEMAVGWHPHFKELLSEGKR